MTPPILPPKEENRGSGCFHCGEFGRTGRGNRLREVYCGAFSIGERCTEDRGDSEPESTSTLRMSRIMRGSRSRVRMAGLAASTIVYSESFSMTCVISTLRSFIAYVPSVRRRTARSTMLEHGFEEGRTAAIASRAPRAFATRVHCSPKRLFLPLVSTQTRCITPCFITSFVPFPFWVLF
ncbi:hypothetical protein VTO73DRAFT_4097 [Trametes versicolor]